ncbi:MAG: DUF4340 domain-containing protein, partial [Desulfamplus sp.]|nr:DUF4340 domain-containing protein [Desulfamplus sp.]
ISKKDGAWVVAGAVPDKAYPADQESITKMLDVIKTLKLSALVSESGNLTPYDLDNQNRINVIVKSKAEIVRKFEIGKNAPSFRHTFVRLDGSSSVYHAEKSFRRDFEKTIDDLRDKKVLSFDKNKISSITMKKGDSMKTVALKDGKPLDNSANQSQSNDTSKENEAVERILTTLSDLKCHSFTNTDNKNEFKDNGIEESAKITLKADADKEISLILYKKDIKENYPAISSENIYPFLLNTYEGNDIISKIDEAMGIKKEENAGGEATKQDQMN